MKDVYIHPTAVIDKPCNIGAGTKIWHYSHVMSGARIGRNCQLGQNVFMAKSAIMGDGVNVQNNVSIYDGVTLGNNVFCGPAVVFTNVINPRSHVSRKHEYKKTDIKRGATLGANSTILCGISIGEFAFVGAGAVVTKDVAPHALVYGNPARVKGWICECGVKLDVKSKKGKCKTCGEIVTLNNA